MNNVVINELQELDINLDNMRVQSYDHEVNMNENYNGMQA